NLLSFEIVLGYLVHCILLQEFIILSLQVYEVTKKVSSSCFKCYDGLSPMQKLEWNNRGFSTVHALVAAAVSFYLVMISGLFSVDVNGIIIDRKSWLSDSMFGVSIGYFLTDLTMILWHFPSLGGKEFLLHHGLSMYAICLALFSGKAHMYILMVLFTEATTPFVNLRWYLDVAGQKDHNLYLYNGLAMFVGWLPLLSLSCLRTPLSTSVLPFLSLYKIQMLRDMFLLNVSAFYLFVGKYMLDTLLFITSQMKMPI
uniref:TLC domain-containing protein n=1 Tax=Aegilops tauschii subsp. strangulata TaxID=200361 RepID=A0A453FSY4_AEGTS